MKYILIYFCATVVVASAQEALRIEEPIIRPSGEVTLAERGFENARLVHSGERMDYYIEPGQRGQNQHIFIHKIKWEERRPIIDLKNGSYTYDPDMIAEMEVAIRTGGAFEDALRTQRDGQVRYRRNQFGIGTLHYYQGYSSPYSLSRNSQERNYERPIAQLRIRNAGGIESFSIDRKSLGGQNGVPGSPIAACMKDQRSLTDTTLQDACRTCGGNLDELDEYELLLLTVGIAEAREVGRGEGVRYYSILGMTQNFVAAIYDADANDKIAPLVPHPTIDHLKVYDLEPLKAALDALDPERISGNGQRRAKVWRFALGVDYESLPFNVTYGKKGHTLVTLGASVIEYADGSISSVGSFDPYNPAPQSVTEFLRIRDEALRRSEIVKAVKGAEMNRDELRAALEIAQAKTAAALGYEVRPDAYWDAFREDYRRQFGNTPTTIPAKQVLDGDFNPAYTVESAPLISRYVELMNDYCPQDLPADAIELDVVTTQGAHMDEGVYQPPRETGRRTLKVDPRFAAAFASNLNSANDTSPSEVFNALRQFFQNGSMTFDIPNMALSAWSVNYLFERESYSGPILKQFGDNLYRMMRNEPSIQSERVLLLAEIAPASPDAAFDEKLLFQTLETDPSHGLAWFRFHNTPAGWLPPSPQALLNRASTDYVPLTYRAHTQKMAPIRAHATIVEPGPDSLKEVGIYIFGDTPGNTKLFDLSIATSGPIATPSGTYDLADPDKRSAIKYRYQQLATAYPPNFVVECRYQNGSVLAYWLDKVPAEADPDVLKSELINHPLLAIGAPRESYPTTYNGPTSLLEPLVE